MAEPNERQGELFELGAELGRDAPLLYVAIPMSHLEEGRDRDHVEMLAYAVDAAIREETRQEHDPWAVRVHSPLKLTAPWKDDGWTEVDVYRINTGKIWCEADGLIVVADRGGSLGIGQEMEWAFNLQLPVLYLYRHGDPVSRQIRGAGTEYDVSIEAFEGPESLRDVVGRWLAARRHVICDGPRLRAGREIRFDQVRLGVARAWRKLSDGERQHIALTIRMPRVRIERLAADPLALAAASAEEMATLCGALGIPVLGDLSARPVPDLLPQQRAALGNAAAEFEWDYETARDLERRARLELARGGVRRLPLASPQDWGEFRRRHGAR